MSTCPFGNRYLCVRIRLTGLPPLGATGDAAGVWLTPGQGVYTRAGQGGVKQFTLGGLGWALVTIGQYRMMARRELFVEILVYLRRVANELAGSVEIQGLSHSSLNIE